MPPPWRAAIQADPALDALSRAGLLKRSAETVQDLADFTAFKAKFDDPTAGPIDLDDPKAAKSADRLYRMLGANPAAAYLIANRTGRIPPSVAAEMNGGIASNDPARMVPTIDLATHLAKDHPDALAMVLGGDDIRNTTSQYWHSIEYRATPDQAIKRIIETRSPEYQDAWTARRKNIDIDAEVAKAVSVRDLNGMFGVDPAATAAMLSDYSELVKERFIATGDMPLSKAQARENLERTIETTDSEAKYANSPDVDETEDETPKYIATMQSCEAAYAACKLSGRDPTVCRNAYIKCIVGSTPIIFSPGLVGRRI